MNVVAKLVKAVFTSHPSDTASKSAPVSKEMEMEIERRRGMRGDG